MLAVLAILGPMDLRGIRACAYLSGPSLTALCGAIAALVAAGLVAVTERSEMAVSPDGVRHRRDYEEFSLVRREGVR